MRYKKVSIIYKTEKLNKIITKTVKGLIRSHYIEKKVIFKNNFEQKEI